jgi:putative transcriptional regulator
MKPTADIFKIKYNDIKPAKGRVLISEPFASDTFFSRSVVLLTEHDEEGTIGFILNKPIKKILSEISSEFGSFDAPVFLGGPVNRDNIYYIHTLGNKLPDSIEIADDLFWGGNFNVLKDLISKGKIKSNEIRFFVGYSGWEKDQLNDEIINDSWLISDVEAQTVMEANDEIWKKLVYKLGTKYRVWTNFPENPNFN